MMSCIGTDCQGSHAVSEKNQRNTREMILDQAVHRMDILQHGIRPATVHIPKILFTAYAFPMATVIMYHTYIFSLCHIFHKRNVAFLVLAHSVNDLYDPTVFLITFQLRHYCQAGNFQSVCF